MFAVCAWTQITVMFKLHANLLKLNTTMRIGKIEAFDEANEEWGTYCERVEQYFLANDIEDDKQVPATLSLMGSKTFTKLVFTSKTIPEAGHFLRIRQWGGGGASTKRDHTIPSVEK
jgi:hypothetical protein